MFGGHFAEKTRARAVSMFGIFDDGDFLRPLSWTRKFSGVFASRSLKTQVFLTKWLLIF